MNILQELKSAAYLIHLPYTSVFLPFSKITLDVGESVLHVGVDNLDKVDDLE